jgi:hypothetical protein
MKNDKDAVMAAVSHSGFAFQYASATMKNDKVVVMTALKHDDNAFYHSSTTIKNDKEVVIAAVSRDCHMLLHASDAMKDDKEVVAAAMTHNSNVLSYASDALKNDRSFVLSMKMRRIRRRYRWPLLVKQAMAFKRHDTSFKQLFEPVNFIETVDDAFLEGDDDVGPQASTFWHAIINKRRKLS